MNKRKLINIIASAACCTVILGVGIGGIVYSLANKDKPVENSPVYLELYKGQPSELSYAGKSFVDYTIEEDKDFTTGSRKENQHFLTKFDLSSGADKEYAQLLLGDDFTPFSSTTNPNDSKHGFYWLDDADGGHWHFKFELANSVDFVRDFNAYFKISSTINTEEGSQTFNTNEYTLKFYNPERTPDIQDGAITGLDLAFDIDFFKSPTHHDLKYYAQKLDVQFTGLPAYPSDSSSSQRMANLQDWFNDNISNGKKDKKANIYAFFSVAEAYLFEEYVYSLVNAGSTRKTFWTPYYDPDYKVKFALRNSDHITDYSSNHQGWWVPYDPSWLVWETSSTGESDINWSQEIKNKFPTYTDDEITQEWKKTQQFISDSELQFYSTEVHVDYIKNIKKSGVSTGRISADLSLDLFKTDSEGTKTEQFSLCRDVFDSSAEFTDVPFISYDIETNADGIDVLSHYADASFDGTSGHIAYYTDEIVENSTISLHPEMKLDGFFQWVCEGTSSNWDKLTNFLNYFRKN